MKDIINDEFERMFNRLVITRPYTGWPHPTRLTIEELKQTRKIDQLSIEQIIAKSIFDVEERSLKRQRIRNDAKVLLILNFSQMVYRPLIRARQWNQKELKELIYDEVRLILMESLKESDEISAHKILEAGMGLWKRLKTMGNGSW